MSAAVISPLGHMPDEEEAHAMVSSLFDDDACVPMTTDDDDDDGASIPSLSEDVLVDIDMSPPHQQQQSFGGLLNLGNTCYQNAAMQMLASLDDFSLERTLPNNESLLRVELLRVLENLENGETVNAEAFKGAVDARSPLFVGYRQQDSHEFLTTLLDLLNEDYKRTTNSDDDDDAMMEDTTTNDDNKPKVETSQEETKIEPAVEQEGTPSSGSRRKFWKGRFSLRSKSLTNLQIQDISDLLHSDDDESSTTDAAATEEQGATTAPQCKLVGGRAIVPMSGMTALESVETETLPFAASLSEIAPQQEDDTLVQQDEPSCPTDDFKTQVRARLTCDSCNYTRSHFESYLHLSLDISPQVTSVEEGLSKFFAPETRQVKCEKCFCETATQTLEIIKLPHAMLLHCKRFIVDVSPDYSSISYRKNTSPYSFGESLDAIDDYCSAECNDGNKNYRMRSVVHHIGSSASCGHYTADAFRLSPTRLDRRWHRFNDARVSEISTEQAMGDSAQQTAYMILYELE